MNSQVRKVYMIKHRSGGVFVLQNDEGGDSVDKSELARLDYESGMKYREIAEKHGVSLNTVKSWKKRHVWSRDKKGCTQKKGAHKKRGGQPGNKNATGPPRNKNAQKHGLFAKYLPDEVNDIVQEIEHKPPIDILWENITLTYANLLHAQRILFVTNEEDHNTFQTSYGAEGESYEVHTAWDKQSKAFQAVARVQAELRQMIKTYDELSRSELVTEEQRARIDVLKAKINVDNNAEDKLNDYFEKLGEAIDAI